MKFVLASNNKGKLREMRDILAPMGIEVASLAELGLDVRPDENGETFEENALIKARAALEASGLPAIADDSGIEVAALGGAPGVHSARFGGEDLPSEQKNELLLELMRGKEDRRARFVSAAVAVFPDGNEIVCRGECHGMLLAAPCGEHGFGYDPLFFMPEFGMTMAEMTDEQKNQCSHRAYAMAALKEKMSEYMKENG